MKKLFVAALFAVSASAYARPDIGAPTRPDPPVAAKGGSVVFQFSDNLGTTNFDVSTTALRADGRILTSFFVGGSSAQIALAQDGADSWDNTKLSGWLRLSIQLPSDNAEFAIWQNEFTRCTILMTAPPYIPDAYKKRSPNWSVTVKLKPADFAEIKQKVKASAGGSVGVDLRVYQLEKLNCEAYNLLVTAQ
jgi:hypothetical protein